MKVSWLTVYIASATQILHRMLESVVQHCVLVLGSRPQQDVASDGEYDEDDGGEGHEALLGAHFACCC